VPSVERQIRNIPTVDKSAPVRAPSGRCHFAQFTSFVLTPMDTGVLRGLKAGLERQMSKVAAASLETSGQKLAVRNDEPRLVTGARGTERLRG
jgi:hypothetical protein